MLRQDFVFLEKSAGDSKNKREFFRLCSKTVYYCTCYIPVTGEVTTGSEDKEYKEYILNSKRIYSSKYRNSVSYNYLFQEIKDDILEIPGVDDIDYVVPVPSSHPLAEKIARMVSDHLEIPFADLLIKLDKNDFTYRPGEKIKRNSKILLVDDIFTSGSAFDESLRVLKEHFGISKDNITLFAIAKTERNFT